MNDFLSSSIKQFEYYKELGEKTFSQLPNEETLIGLNGLKSSYKTIAFHIDEKEQFERELNTYR
jgi:viroplasmin and RNaseH domain-containing protein